MHSLPCHGQGEEVVQKGLLVFQNLNPKLPAIAKAHKLPMSLLPGRNRCRGLVECTLSIGKPTQVFPPKTPRCMQMSTGSLLAFSAFAVISFQFLMSCGAWRGWGSSPFSNISSSGKECSFDAIPSVQNSFLQVLSCSSISSDVCLPSLMEQPNTRLRRCGKRKSWASTLE